MSALVLTVPEGCGLPVVVVVCEAGQSGQATVIPLFQPLLQLPLLLPPPDLVEELSLPVNLLPGGQRERANLGTRLTKSMKTRPPFLGTESFVTS